MYDAATREVLSDCFGFAVGDYSKQDRPSDSTYETEYEFTETQKEFYEVFIQTGKELQEEMEKLKGE